MLNIKPDSNYLKFKLLGPVLINDMQTPLPAEVVRFT